MSVMPCTSESIPPANRASKRWSIKQNLLRMTKVALYTRYSSDNQSVASIEDQFRICREHAARETWHVVGTYHDAAISGASVIRRPGIQSLLQNVQRGRFEIALAEALDRMSRDQADVATLFKHLRFAGVQIITLSEGETTEFHVGLKGAMNALFLKDLAAKTHRGIRGRVEKGKSGGGFGYGYDVVKRTDAERIPGPTAPCGPTPHCAATPRAAPASYCMSAGCSGTGSVTSRTRRPASASRV